MLQQESGAFIQTQRDNEAAPGSTERELYIAGTPEQIELARDAVAAIIAQCPEQQQPQNRAASSESKSTVAPPVTMSMELSAGMQLQPVQTMSLTDGLQLTAVDTAVVDDSHGGQMNKRARHG